MEEKVSIPEYQMDGKVLEQGMEEIMDSNLGQMGGQMPQMKHYRVDSLNDMEDTTYLESRFSMNE